MTTRATAAPTTIHNPRPKLGRGHLISHASSYSNGIHIHIYIHIHIHIYTGYTLANRLASCPITLDHVAPIDARNHQTA